jgi:hypothetical protein
MIMIDQSKRLSEPLRWGGRERTAVAVVATCLLLAVVGLGVHALTSGSSQRMGCIDVTFASTVGGASLQACGERARAACASPSAYRSIADSLREACRRAGYPYDQQPAHSQ